MESSITKVTIFEEKRTDWTLRSEEILKGFTALQDVRNTHCGPIGGGEERYIAPNDSLDEVMYIRFNSLEVCQVYSEVYGVEWPMEVRREISDREYHAMFLEVRDYIPYEYVNSYTEEVYMTVHPQKRIP